MRSLILLVLLNVLISTCTPKVESTTTNTFNITEKSNNDTKIAASSNNPNYTPAPTDFWRSGMGQALSISGIFVSTLMVLAGLTWLFTPFFGLRMCNLFGNCEKAAIAYNSGGNLQDENLQSVAMNDPQQYSYNNIPNYYKRSVDFVAPIIKNLASAVHKM